MCALSTLLTQGNSGANSSLHFAELAQLVERRLAKAKVAGSNPVFRSNSQAGFTAVSALGPAFSLAEPGAGGSRVENGSTLPVSSVAVVSMTWASMARGSGPVEGATAGKLRQRVA